MGIEEIRVGIAQAEQQIETARQTLWQAQSQVGEAVNTLAAILQGAEASEAAEAVGVLQGTDEMFGELSTRLSMGAETAVAYGQRL